MTKLIDAFFDKYDEIMNEKIVFVIWVVLIIALSPPEYLTRFTLFHIIIVVCKVFAYLYLLLSSCRGLKELINRKDSHSLIFLGLIVALNLLLIVATIYNNESLYEALNYCLPLMLVGFSYAGLKSENRKAAFDGISTILLWYACVNLISIIFFRDGLYLPEDASGKEAYYFLGHNNSTIRVLFPGIVLSGICDLETTNKISIKTICFIVVVALQVIITGSITAVIGMAVMALYFIFKRIKRIKKFFHPFVFSAVPVLLLVLVVICGVQNLFSFFLESVLGKTGSLSGRTLIWSLAMNCIKAHPFLGYGIGRSFSEITGLFFNASSAHNYLLDLSLRGGIFCAIILQAVVCIFMYRLEKHRSPFRAWLSFAFLAYFVMWTVEPFMSTGVFCMYLLFTVAYTHNEFSVKASPE